MPEATTRLDLPILLPEVPDARDECVARLVQLLEHRPGVARVHVVRAGEATPAEFDVAAGPSRAEPELASEAQLCLHYDPDVLTLIVLPLVYEWLEERWPDWAATLHRRVRPALTRDIAELKSA